MRVRVLGGWGGLCPGRLLTSFQINEDTIMDAGSMAESLSIEEQSQVRHILLTHAHLDHSGTLPFFVDNIFGLREEPFVVYSIPEAVKSVRDHLFNNDIWPDFSMIPDFKRAAMRFAELREDRWTPVGGLRVLAVRVNHTVPAVGYLIEEGGTVVLFSGDTAPTERLWEVAAAVPHLRAVFIETSFPNRLQKIADVSGHLTPQAVRDELQKLGRDVPVLSYHLKPRFYAEIAEELKALGIKDLGVVEQGRTYVF